MTELKPCPFCGRNDIKTYESWDTSYYGPESKVYCPDCHAAMTFGSIQELIDKWNTRVME